MRDVYKFKSWWRDEYGLGSFHAQTSKNRYARALNHIMTRVDEHKKIFRENKDRDDFITRLGKLLWEAATPATRGLDPQTCAPVTMERSQPAVTLSVERGERII